MWRRLAARAAAVLCLLAAGATAPAAASPPAPSGGLPCALGLATAAPVGSGACPGVRPGGSVSIGTSSCTFGFLFAGSDGRRYIASAGHCVLGSPLAPGQSAGERSWARGSGPVARDGAGVRIGEVAYAVLEAPRDFALIRLDAGVAATAAVCHFGGPTAIDSSRPSGLVALQYFGDGVGVAALTPARTAYALGMPSPDYVLAHGLASPGDSGAPVTSGSGAAIGIVVSTGLQAGAYGDSGEVGISRLAPQLARAQRVLGLRLSLRTAAAG